MDKFCDLGNLETTKQEDTYATVCLMTSALIANIK